MIIFLIMLIVGMAILWNDSASKTRGRARAEDGNPKLEMKVVQFDDVPQNVSATVICDENTLQIKTSAYKKTLLHENIVAIDLTHASDISTNSHGFSVGRAVAGMALLGGVGAVAGVSGKNKEKPKVLVISYKEKDEVKYMVFSQSYDEDANKYESALITVMHGEMVSMMEDKRGIDRT